MDLWKGRETEGGYFMKELKEIYDDARKEAANANGGKIINGFSCLREHLIYEIAGKRENLMYYKSKVKNESLDLVATIFSVAAFIISLVSVIDLFSPRDT